MDTGLIDVHAHLLPDFYVQKATAAGQLQDLSEYLEAPNRASRTNHPGMAEA